MAKVTRRGALGALAVPALVAARAHDGAAREGAAPTFTLLLVNDIYRMSAVAGRGGFGKLAAIVTAERERGVPMLFCHAGDTFSPSLMSGFDQGAHIVILTNLVRPDVFVPGNHEFDFGPEVYFKRIGEADFPIFAANLRDGAGRPLPGHFDRRLFDLGGIKLGVVGLALVNTPQVSSPGDLLFLPVMETLRAQVAALRREGAEFLVAVTHTPRPVDYEIARSRLVDVLLTGHDHDLFVNFDGRTAIVESNIDGNYVTALDIMTDIRAAEGGGRQVTWWPSFRVHDSADFAPDPAVQERVERYEAELSSGLDVVVARLAVELDSRVSAVRARETGIGDLVADAVRASLKAKVALVNGGSIRGNRLYRAGTEWTRRDVLTELPFGNRGVVTEITGAALRAALEHGFSELDRPVGRFPQLSGLRVVADARQPAGTRVVSVMVGDTALDDDAVYRLATNDYLLGGGDGYTMLAAPGEVSADAGSRLMANDVMVYARKLGVIDSSPDGRIVIER